MSTWVHWMQLDSLGRFFGWFYACEASINIEEQKAGQLLSSCIGDLVFGSRSHSVCMRGCCLLVCRRQYGAVPSKLPQPWLLGDALQT